MGGLLARIAILEIKLFQELRSIASVMSLLLMV
jgi:hypothetical protein